MREIVLSSGEVCFVDDLDYEFLSQWHWVRVRSKSNLYAGRTVRTGRGFGKLLMHRLLTGAIKGQQVDHIDRNTLNNCRTNLRLCKQSENNANSVGCPSQRKYSSYKGVGMWNHDGYAFWTARVKKGGKYIHRSYHKTEKEAALAYDSAAREAFGNFARLNFPLDGEQPAIQQGG